ncbi:UNVERIFIED_ORG: hypothetical protein M2328_004609 [Rhodococcus erythropolis]
MTAPVITAPPYECPTSRVGPSIDSANFLVRSTSSASEVSGFWTATTRCPALCRVGMT